LPADLGLGAGYLILPNLRTDLSFNYYFNTQAGWDGKENDHDDGWEAALSAEYTWPIRLSTSAGFEYTVTGAKPISYQVENPALNSYTIGLGGRYPIGKNFSIAAGWAGNFAFDDTTPVTALKTTADLKKHVLVYALGLDYHLF
jgi:long-subunit fatty acid transport protein